MAKKKAEKNVAALIENASAPIVPPVIEFPIKADLLTPKKVRCPRCGSLESLVTSTREEFQYRVCLAPICRRSFKSIRI